jgi:predicted aspartyl protease
MRTAIATFTLAALAATPTLAAPSADEILAANKAATAGSAWDGKAVLKIEYAYSGQGLTGKVGSTADLKTPRFVDTMAVGPMTGAQGFDGTHGWAKDQSGTITAQDGGDALPLAINEAYRNTNAWWAPDHGGATVVAGGQKSDGGITYDVLTVTPKGGQNFDAWFDSNTHLLARLHEVQGSAPTTTTFSDYRRVDGVMIPGKILISTGDVKYDQTESLNSAAFGPALDASAYAAPKNAVADYAIAGGAKETTFPFQLINNHIYAQVKINGKGPYTFIFDTGGTNTVSPSLAKALGLNIEGHLEVRGGGSGTMDAGFAKVGQIQIGDASLKEQLFFTIPLDSMANIEGVEQPGMVGFETFRRFVTRIDYGTHTITLINPKTFDPRDAGTPVKVVFDGNVPEVEGSYNGASGKFMIDTGARSALLLTGPFADKNGFRANAGKGVEAMTGWGVGGPTRSFVQHGGDLKIGTVDVENPLTLLSTDKGGAMAEGNLAGNIGGGVLKRFVITFDYEKGAMYLKPVAGAVADLDTYDRAGLWINRDPQGFKVIDVTAHAPADEAGLKTGDIITAIDGKAAASLSLPDLRYRFRNDAPGTVVTFAVTRGTETKDVRVTLRDLI